MNREKGSSRYTYPATLHARKLRDEQQQPQDLQDQDRTSFHLRRRLLSLSLSLWLSPLVCVSVSDRFSLSHVLVGVGPAAAGEANGGRRHEVEPQALGGGTDNAVAARRPCLHRGLAVGAHRLRLQPRVDAILRARKQRLQEKRALNKSDIFSDVEGKMGYSPPRRRTGCVRPSLL